MVKIKDYSTKTICEKCGFEARNMTFRRCPKCKGIPMKIISDYQEEES